MKNQTIYKKFNFLFPVSLLFLLVANQALGESPTFNQTVKPLLKSKCIKCHSGSNPASGMDLSKGKKALVNVNSSEVKDMKRVSPGNPDKSYFYHKLKGTHLKAGGSGRPMPLGQGQLSKQDIQNIFLWIEGGAR